MANLRGNVAGERATRGPGGPGISSSPAQQIASAEGLVRTLSSANGWFSEEGGRREREERR